MQLVAIQGHADATLTSDTLAIGTMRSTLAMLNSCLAKSQAIDPWMSVGREPLKRTRAPLGIDELDLLVGIRGEHPSPERGCGSVVRRLGHLPGPRMAVDHQMGGLTTH